MERTDRRAFLVDVGRGVLHAGSILGAITLIASPAAARQGPGGGQVSFRPNPAPAGGEVEVTFSGTPPLYVRTAGPGGWKEVPLDANVRGRVRVPTGYRALLFSDLRDPSVSAELEVVDTNR